jgi:hypothetical protein
MVTPHKLILPPDQTSYTVTDNTNEVLRVQLDGGAARYRRDILKATKLVNVQWIADRDEYSYLQMFNRVMTQERSGQAFKIDLILGEWGLTEHDAYFIPGTFQLDSQAGFAYTVTAQLEVIPVEYDTVYEDQLLDLIALYDGIENFKSFLNILNNFANYELPTYLRV